MLQCKETFLGQAFWMKHLGDSECSEQFYKYIFKNTQMSKNFKFWFLFTYTPNNEKKFYLYEVNISAVSWSKLFSSFLSPKSAKVFPNKYLVNQSSTMFVLIFTIKMTFFHYDEKHLLFLLNPNATKEIVLKQAIYTELTQ